MLLYANLTETSPQFSVLKWLAVPPRPRTTVPRSSTVWGRAGHPAGRAGIEAIGARQQSGFPAITQRFPGAIIKIRPHQAEDLNKGNSMATTHWLASVVMAAGLSTAILTGGAAVASADDTGSPSNSYVGDAPDSPISIGSGAGGVTQKTQKTRNLHQLNELNIPRTFGP